MDFAIALLLFTFTLVVYFSYTNNFQKQEKGELDVLITNAKAISSSLALSGYPPGWSNSTVIRIGIADEQKVNLTKVSYFSKLKYNDTKRKFATNYDYFAFFTDDQGEVLNIFTVCGVGDPLVTTTYNVKSAYYYQEEEDSFLLRFVNETFHGDIYFDDNPSNSDDIDSLISNISKYRILVMEHPNFPTSVYNNYKGKLENFTSTGGFFLISGELTTAQGKRLMGTDFYKKSGQSTSDRNSTVNNSDQYMSLNVGENIIFRQAYYVENNTDSDPDTLDAAGFLQLATFNADGTNALSKWKYGNGTVYFFSDFDVSFFSGNFTNLVEEGAKALIEGTCTPVNISNINPQKLAKVERYLNYNSKVVKMVVYVWQ